MRLKHDWGVATAGVTEDDDQRDEGGHNRPENAEAEGGAVNESGPVAIFGQFKLPKGDLTNDDGRNQDTECQNRRSGRDIPDNFRDEETVGSPGLHCEERVLAESVHG